MNDEPRLIESALRGWVDGLVLLDTQSRVVFWNQRANVFLNCPPGERLADSADALVERLLRSTPAPDNLRERLQTAVAERNPERVVEIEITQAGDGAATRILAINCFPIENNGHVEGTGIVLRDVTRERTADALKTQLLATVSHELRTPLASIKGFATTLLRQDVQWDEATQRDFLRIIEEESDRLTEIIDNLLDMSQIEAGALRVAKQPTQLRKLIRQVADEMRMRTEAHYFVVDLPAEMPRVDADPRRIRQVLVNLIGNAIKYSKRGQITVACEVDDGGVTISVSDQGEGIPANLHHKIFDHFFQIDGASTRRVGGSGLGLAISRGIIEAHHGKIWVESVQGQGSTFRFTLPIAGDEVEE